VISKISLILKSLSHSLIKQSITYYLKDGKDQLRRSYERSVIWINGGRVRGRKGGRKERRKKDLRKIKSRKDNWIGYTLRMNCLLKHVFGVKKESEARRRCKQLLDDIEEKKRTGI
jgi:hypothetical protein